MIVCTGDCQFLTSCFYWNFSICNYTWTFGTTCTHNIHFFFNRFFQPFKITVHLPPHTRIQNTTKQHRVKNERKKMNRATIPSLNIAFTYTQSCICVYPNVCVWTQPHTQSRIVSHHSKSFSLLYHVWVRVRVYFSLCVCVLLLLCIFLLGFKMKVNQSCTLLLFGLAVYLSFFIQSLFGFLCLSLLFGLIFFSIISISFSPPFNSYFSSLYSHTQNTIHSLTWMQKK